VSFVGAVVASTGKVRRIATISTVSEIEAALEKLPVEAQRQVAARSEQKLWPETPAFPDE